MKRFFFFLLLSVLGGEAAFAAKPARVDIDQVEVREGPGLNYPVVTTLSKNAAVASSNIPIEGYFKVRDARGRVGFVPADSLNFVEPSAEGPAFTLDEPPTRKAAQGGRKATKPEGERHRWVQIRMLGGYAFFAPAEINALIVSNQRVLQNGFHFGGELGIRFNRWFAAVVRGEGLLQMAYATELGGNSYQWTLNGYPFMAGGELSFWSNRWVTMNIGALGGVGIATAFSSRALKFQGNNVTTYSGLSYGFIGRLGFGVTPVPWLLLGIEGGYRFLRTSALSPTQIGSGGEILQVNGQYPPLSIDMSGPFGSLVIGFQF